jgi:hypothetical protein
MAFVFWSPLLKVATDYETMDGLLSAYDRVRGCSSLMMNELLPSTLAAILKMNGFNARFFVGPFEGVNAAKAEARIYLIRRRNARALRSRSCDPNEGKCSTVPLARCYFSRVRARRADILHEAREHGP